jgi:hypothetical protein
MNFMHVLANTCMVQSFCVSCRGDLAAVVVAIHGDGMKFTFLP